MPTLGIQVVLLLQGWSGGSCSQCISYGLSWWDLDMGSSQHLQVFLQYQCNQFSIWWPDVHHVVWILDSSHKWYRSWSDLSWRDRPVHIRKRLQGKKHSRIPSQPCLSFLSSLQTTPYKWVKTFWSDAILGKFQFFIAQDPPDVSCLEASGVVPCLFRIPVNGKSWNLLPKRSFCQRRTRIQ